MNRFGFTRSIVRPNHALISADAHVQAGDVIWMGPYCAQWFCAVGKVPATYLYYKDVNRSPLG